MDVTAEAEALFSSNLRRKDKTLLFGITIVNSSVSSNPNTVVQHATKENTPQTQSPCRRRRAEEEQISGLVSSYLLPHSFCLIDLGEARPKIQAVTKDLAIKRVENSSNIQSNKFRNLVKG